MGKEGNLANAILAILDISKNISTPDGSVVKIIRLNETIEISENHDIPRRLVEIEALAREIIPTRYLRNYGTLGALGQIKLLKSVVGVIGVGGLGGIIVRNLARIGVGSLVIVDGDVFSEDNLNRQEFATEKTVGKVKVEVVAEELKQINGAVDVKGIQTQAGEEEFQKILKGADAVVDALDNLPSRFALQRAAVVLNVPVVHGSVAGFVGQVSTILPGDSGYSTIYGDEDELPERGVETSLGNLPGVVGTVASLQSVEVIKILTGLGEAIRNKLLFFDLENSIFEIFTH
jgi:molybdopterin-synthase adenylyltransferase